MQELSRINSDLPEVPADAHAASNMPRAHVEAFTSIASKRVGDMRIQICGSPSLPVQGECCQEWGFPGWGPWRRLTCALIAQAQETTQSSLGGSGHPLARIWDVESAVKSFSGKRRAACTGLIQGCSFCKAQPLRFTPSDAQVAEWFGVRHRLQHEEGACLQQTKHPCIRCWGVEESNAGDGGLFLKTFWCVSR